MSAQRGPSRRLWLCLLSLVVSAELASCVYECGPTCTTTVFVNAHLPGAPHLLSGVTVEWCINSSCTSGTFASVSDTATTSVVLMGSFIAGVDIVSETTGAEVSVYVLGKHGYTDGDTHVVTVTDQTDVVVFQGSAVAKYGVHDDCGGSCQEFMADLYPP